MPYQGSTLTKGAQGAAAVYNSPAIDQAQVSKLRVCVITDQVGTLAVEQSDDGVDWYESLSVAVPANVNGKATIVESMSVMAQSRVKYTNGATPTMAKFRIDVDQLRGA